MMQQVKGRCQHVRCATADVCGPTGPVSNSGSRTTYKGAYLQAVGIAPVPTKAFRTQGVHGWILGFNSRPSTLRFTLEINSSTHEDLLVEEDKSIKPRSTGRPQVKSSSRHRESARPPLSHAVRPDPLPAQRGPVSGTQSVDSQRLQILEDRFDKLVFPKFRPPLGNSSMHRAFINGKALETLRHLSTQGMMPCCDAFGQCSMFGLSDSLIDFAMDFVCMSVFLPSWLRLCLFSVGLPMAFFTVHCPLFGVQCYSIAFFSIASLLYVGGIVSISFRMFNVCRRPGDVLTVAVDLPP